MEPFRTTAEDDDAAAARKLKRARTLTPSPSEGEGDADLISGLDDDVLLHVLSLVADASDVVRAGAVSRRWLGLSTRVPALRFAAAVSPSPASNSREATIRRAEQCAALERYVSFVDGVLARRRRSDSTVVESLDISCTLVPQRITAPVHAVQGWIQYAFEHGVKSFTLDLPWPLFGPTVVLDELPCPSTLQTMRLALSYGLGRIPTTIKFASLTDLSLERMSIAVRDLHLLGRLVSTDGCPCLQKLRMARLQFPYLIHEEGMRVEAVGDDANMTLLQLRNRLRVLQLRNPCLRVLHVHDCNPDVVRVSTPSLEELELSFQTVGYNQIQICSPRCVDIDGDSLPHVRTLKICLWAYYPRDFLCDGEAVNDASKRLIKLCSSVTCLDVSLHGPKVSKDQEVDILKSRIPHLPHITSLNVNVSALVGRHHFGSSVATLLTRFNNLRHLNIHLPFHVVIRHYELEECDHPDPWISSEISMSHLQELEFTGLTGTDCELWFMKTMLASAKRLHKVDISFHPKFSQNEGKMDEFEGMLLDEGMWTSYSGTLKLTCLK